MWRQIFCKHQIVREQSIVNADNLGAFYQYVNKRISNRTSMNAVVGNGLILTHSTEKANAFNHYFASVGVRDNGLVSRCCMSAELNETLEFVNIKEEDVNRSIVKLKSSLSAGPDNLPPFFCLRKFVEVLAGLLQCYVTRCCLWGMYLVTGCVQLSSPCSRKVSLANYKIIGLSL